jgi:protein involved in polysaccharide export with SLBB domain
MLNMILKGLLRIGLAFTCLLAMAWPCWGQGLESQAYKVQPEDTLQIQVFGQQQIAATVVVARDGSVSAPFLGSVPAAGRTIDELITELTKRYERDLRLRDPIVSVTIAAFRQLKATIGGAVQRPGPVPFRYGDTVLSLLNSGGGPIPDAADLRRAYLRHNNSIEVIPIDLYSMTVLGDMSQNYTLQDGDEITVPQERNNRIIITGAVQRPGQYPYHEPMTLADSIALAGGEIRYRSRFSHTTILRQKPGLPGEYIKINADFVRFVRNGDQTQNVVLEPGDFVFVPESDSPDVNMISELFNVAYILNVVGGGNVFTHVFGG